MYSNGEYRLPRTSHFERDQRRVFDIDMKTPDASPQKARRGREDGSSRQDATGAQRAPRRPRVVMTECGNTVFRLDDVQNEVDKVAKKFETTEKRTDRFKKKTEKDLDELADEVDAISRALGDDEAKIKDLQQRVRQQQRTEQLARSEAQLRQRVTELEAIVFRSLVGDAAKGIEKMGM
ncbi:hypothetical protein ACJZ2D_007609 [Fusarium nematophilum]